MSQFEREDKISQFQFAESRAFREESEPYGGLYVMKFGGTSVESAEMMKRVAEIIQGYHEDGKRIIVVTSAMKGVTDQLSTICDHIERKNYAERNNILNKVINIHIQAMKNLSLKDEERRVLEEDLYEVLYGEYDGKFEDSLLADVVNEFWMTPELSDRILSYGERLSARLLVASLHARRINTLLIDSTNVIKTTSDFGQGNVLFNDTEKNAQHILNPLLKADIIPVVTGFIGSTSDGKITTLGRGGSDYTASIIGRVIKAGEVWIWTDVDGVYTTDPKVDKDAKVIPEMTYELADVMAKDGHKVLCSRTIEPLFGTKIVLRVKNTFNPSAPGTKISSLTTI